MRQRLAEPADRQVAGQLPQRVERGDDPGLARERAEMSRPPGRPAPRPTALGADARHMDKQQPGHEEPGREQSGLLPGEHNVRHGN
jgi:hypothetical protein